MSADNYYLIRRHPQGGYTAVMGFASDCNPDGSERTPKVRPDRDRQFDTVEAAMEWAEGEYSEYGVSVHPECEWPQAKPKNTPELGQKDVSQGWMCPRCGAWHTNHITLGACPACQPH